MQLHDAIHTYLICIVAEGRSRRVEREYRYVLDMLAAIVDDMDVAALAPDHFRRYMTVIPINEPYELRKHMAVLNFFYGWVRAQNQIRPLANRYDPTRKPSGWRLMTPRRLAVRRKLPLAL